MTKWFVMDNTIMVRLPDGWTVVVLTVTDNLHEKDSSIKACYWKVKWKDTRASEITTPLPSKSFGEHSWGVWDDMPHTQATTVWFHNKATSEPVKLEEAPISAKEEKGSGVPVWVHSRLDNSD